MSSCILCLKPTKRSKITLNELIIDKTVKEVIIEQFSNHELILTGSSSASQAICPTCCKHFKDFYNFKKDINQKLSEVAVKVEEVPVDFVNFVKVEEPVLDYDLKQLEINIERVKTEPQDIEQFVREFMGGQETSTVVNEEVTEEYDSAFEWQLDNDGELIPPKKKKTQRSFSGPGTSSYEKRCEKIFKNRTSQQIIDDTRIKKFCDLKCYECDTQTNSYFELFTHFKKEHPGIKFYAVCCFKKYFSRHRLLDHIDYHDKTKDFSCEICGKAFMKANLLQLHVEYKHEGKKRKEDIHVCPHCGKICKSLTIFKRHMMTHEEDEKGRTFECFKCHSTYKNQQLLKYHFNGFHNPKRKREKTCHICQKVVPINSFPSHVNRFHKRIFDEKEQCKICSNWLAKVDMKRHMQKHVEPGVTCDVCSKFFKKRHTYLVHNRMAHGEPGKFECGFCDKRFVQDLKLIEHTAVIHTREFPWKCRVRGCGKEYRAETLWKKHEREEHPEIYEKYFKPKYKRDPNEPPPDLTNAPIEMTDGRAYRSDPGVNCDVCGKYLRLTSWLQKHKNDFHTDSLPKFCCTLCDAKFNQQQDLEDHIDSAHTKKISFTCRNEGCGRGFSRIDGWKRHEMTIHPEEYARLPSTVLRKRKKQK